MPAGGRFSTRPLYLQVRDALAERIEGGVWKPGCSVPNENELAREFGVSSGTMRKALELMAAERLIARRQGRGTFVADPTTKAASLDNLYGQDGERTGGNVQVAEITAGAATVPERVRLQLRDSDIDIYRFRRVIASKHRVCVVEDAVVPADLFPGLPSKTAVACDITLLASAYGVLAGKVEERISLAEAPAAVADILRVPPGFPVMVLDRVIFTFDGLRALEWRLAYCHPEETHYIARMS
jgi:GntR family transcriptional regulator